MPTTARGPRLGAVASLALHGAIVAAMVFVFQRNIDMTQDSHVVPVDLVTIARQTNVAAAAPPVPPTPKPEEMTAPPMPELAQAEPAPDVPPLPKITMEDPKKQDDVAALLNKLTTPSTPQKTTKNAAITTQDTGLSSAMTASLADALRSQIRPCWHPIPGAPRPEDEIVDFDLRLNQDGSVASLEPLTPQNGNPYTKAAAGAATSAVMQCQYANGHTGYQLPAQSYNQWREFRPLRFDPRQMLEQ